MQKKSCLYLSVVSAQESLFYGDVSSIQVSGVEGEFGILPGHTPLLTRIKPGAVRLTDLEHNTQIMYLSGGIIEVQPHKVIILADVAIRGEELDEKAAEEAKRQAEESMAMPLPKEEYSEAALQLACAVAKLRVIKMLRTLKKRR